MEREAVTVNTDGARGTHYSISPLFLALAPYRDTPHAFVRKEPFVLISSLLTYILHTAADPFPDRVPQLEPFLIAISFARHGTLLHYIRIIVPTDRLTRTSGSRQADRVGYNFPPNLFTVCTLKWLVIPTPRRRRRRPSVGLLPMELLRRLHRWWWRLCWLVTSEWMSEWVSSGRLVGWLVGSLTHSVGRSVGWLAAWLIERPPADESSLRPEIHSIDSFE